MENFKPEIKPVPVSRLFDYLHNFFANTNNVHFTFDAPDKLEINTDENYLQTIMHNLTANAVKALKDTTAATIHWKAEKKGEKVLLSVTDNGPGIAKEKAAALFNDTPAANAKHGLGFYLVRDLAKAIRCSISLQTPTGSGATFILEQL